MPKQTVRNNIWKLKLQGLSATEIADKLDLSVDKVAEQLVDIAASNSLDNHIPNLALQVAVCQLTNLDNSLATLQTELEQDIQNTGRSLGMAEDLELGFLIKQRYSAIDGYTKVMDKRLKIHDRACKLLGLYAPVKEEKVVQLNVEKELDKVLDRLEGELSPEGFQKALRVLAEADE